MYGLAGHTLTLCKCSMNEWLSALRSWQATTFAPLKTHSFRIFWIATTAANFGSVIQIVGASWLMTMIEPAPHMVALVQTAAMGPMVVLALPAGALADSADGRIQMLASQIIGLAGASVLAAISIAGQASPLVLLALTMLIGCAMALHQPAWQASFPVLVPRDQLPAAVGLNSLSFNIARSLAPAIGGTVIVSLGIGATFLINALTFLVLAIVLATQTFPARPRRLPPEPIGAALVAGIRYASLAPALRRAMLRGVLFTFFASALWSSVPLIAHEQLGGGPLEYGVLLGGFGVGSLCAAVMSASARTRLGADRLVTLATVLFALATLTILASRWLALSTAIMIIAGASWILVLSTLSTSVQLSSPRWVVGRAVALSQVGIVGGMSVGAVVWGLLAAASSLSFAFLVAGGLFLACLPLMIRLPLPANDGEDMEPHTIGVLEPRARIEPNSGPISFLIEYRVPLDQAEDFLTLMHAVGRIRRRDGARRWRIHQDIDNPEIWWETVENATWIDFLRRMDRSTVGDVALRDRASAYRVEGSVRRMIERPPGSKPLQVP